MDADANEDGDEVGGEELSDKLLTDVRLSRRLEATALVLAIIPVLFFVAGAIDTARAPDGAFDDWTDRLLFLTRGAGVVGGLSLLLAGVAVAGLDRFGDLRKRATVPVVSCSAAVIALAGAIQLTTGLAVDVGWSFAASALGTLAFAGLALWICPRPETLGS